MPAQILALDTSTDACSVALQANSGIYARFEIAPRKHTQLLLPMVESVLSEAGIGVADLDAIAFGCGPGSFAGIRIATGAAQGLALAHETPMIAVSTLETLALSQLLEDPLTSRVVTVLDARMDEVYWGCFEMAADLEQVVSVAEERVSSPDQVFPPDSFTSFDLVGSGVAYLSQMSAQVQASVRKQNSECYPDARVMLKIAQQHFDRGRTLKVEDALPVYLREGSWKKRNEQ